MEDICSPYLHPRAVGQRISRAAADDDGFVAKHDQVIVAVEIRIRGARWRGWRVGENKYREHRTKMISMNKCEAETQSV